MYVSDNVGYTGFHYACSMGNLNVVQFLIQQQGFDMNIVDNYGKTGFHCACLNGNSNIIQFLAFQQGFEMNKPPSYRLVKLEELYQ
jgi:ankyrin repeat protein